MKNWYRPLIPGRMPLVLGWVIAFLGTAALLVWVATSVGGGIVIPLQAGDTIRFEQVRQAAGTTKAHHFTVEALGIDIDLNDGRFEADTSACVPDPGPPGDAADDVDAAGPGLLSPPVDPISPSGPVDLYEITFPDPGRFAITDCTDPRAHGRAAFIVTESDGRTPRLIVTGVFEVEDRLFVLLVPQSGEQFGYDPGTRVPSRSPGDQLIFFSLMGGSALAAPLIARAKRRRWWLWGLFGLIGGFLGVAQPLITSATVMGAALLSEPYRPPPPDVDDEEPEDGDGPEADDPGADDPGTEDLSAEDPADVSAEEQAGPPTQDQRTLPAAPPRPRPPRPRRRPRH